MYFPGQVSGSSTSPTETPCPLGGASLAMQDTASSPVQTRPLGACQHGKDAMGSLLPCPNMFSGSWTCPLTPLLRVPFGVCQLRKARIGKSRESRQVCSNSIAKPDTKAARAPHFQQPIGLTQQSVCVCVFRVPFSGVGLQGVSKGKPQFWGLP